MDQANAAFNNQPKNDVDPTYPKQEPTKSTKEDYIEFEEVKENT